MSNATLVKRVSSEERYVLEFYVVSSLVILVELHLLRDPTMVETQTKPIASIAMNRKASFQDRAGVTIQAESLEDFCRRAHDEAYSWAEKEKQKQKEKEQLIEMLATLLLNAVAK